MAIENEQLRWQRMPSRGTTPIEISATGAMFIKGEVFDDRIRESTRELLIFGDEFTAYRQRNPLPADFQALVTDEAVKVREKVEAMHNTPDVMYAIPARSEIGIDKAVHAILENCVTTNTQPFIVVYNNFDDRPTPQSLEALSRIRNLPMVHIIDLRTGGNNVIGDIRDLPVEVIVQAINDDPVMSQNPPIIGFGDGDITQYDSEGTVGQVVDTFRKARESQTVVDVVKIIAAVDLQSLEDNAYAYLTGLLDNEFRIVDTLTGQREVATIGYASFYDPATLCALGLVPPLTLGEDRAMGVGVRRLRSGMETTVTYRERIVRVDDRKRMLNLIAQGDDYYETWGARINKEKAELPALQEISLTLAAEMLMRKFTQYTLNVVNTRKVTMQLYAVCVLFNRFADVLFDNTAGAISVPLVRQLDGYSREFTDQSAVVSDQPTMMRQVNMAREKMRGVREYMERSNVPIGIDLQMRMEIIEKALTEMTSEV